MIFQRKTSNVMYIQRLYLIGGAVFGVSSLVGVGRSPNEYIDTIRCMSAGAQQMQQNRDWIAQIVQKGYIK